MVAKRINLLQCNWSVKVLISGVKVTISGDYNISVVIGQYFVILSSQSDKGGLGHVIYALR